MINREEHRKFQVQNVDSSARQLLRVHPKETRLSESSTDGRLLNYIIMYSEEDEHSEAILTCYSTQHKPLHPREPPAIMSSSDKVTEAHNILFDAGIKMRTQVAGKEYVDRALKNGSTPFSRCMQDFVTESCWGSIWTRPGLALGTRSLLNIVMLCALNRSTELAVHVRGALNNGCSEVEIREAILQAAAYCGMPAGIEGFRVAQGVLDEWKAQKEKEGTTRGARDTDIGMEQRIAE
ncbi:hypothetical protein LTR66_000711 [Elasticomyces elasticus]|nr:hypothetical protein LTR66_000711 [Elasticomyces elasticus]